MGGSAGAGSAGSTALIFSVFLVAAAMVFLRLRAGAERLPRPPYVSLLEHPG
jgi:hypothetical protein